ncbi:amino acid adenylation domain-containing protein [Chryseobacterium sp. SIMBA_029]|uniref:non-ribosomal peptide synthetase n=4 Tax=Bacteria TaxID=2 RepID=UPI00397BB4C4
MKELLKKLNDLNIVVSLQDDNLNLKAPKDTLTKELLEEIKSHKAELIQFFKSYKRDVDLFNSIPKVPVQDNYPLSSSQQRLWLLSQFEGGSETYNIPATYEIEGTLDIGALEASFNFLITRHESLRTFFKEDENGEVRQYILDHNANDFRLNFKNLMIENNSNIIGVILEEEQKAFTLSEGPLIRVTLLQLSEAKYILSFVMHHIISDGWSMGIIVEELFAFYESYIKKEAYTKMPLQIQYKDYAVWQQNQLIGESLEKHKTYWTHQFKGDIPILKMPTQKQRPAIKTYNGSSKTKKINKDLLKRLKNISESQGNTLFMTLTAVVKVLLYRYTHQEDIIIGSPIAERVHPDLANQIGFYVNTLPLRTHVNGKESFVDLVAKVKKITLEAYQYQMYPLDELVSDLALKRDISRNALFDVIIDFQSLTENKETKINLDNIKISRCNLIENKISKFDFQFNFVETSEDLNLELIYNTDIYDHDFIIQLINHFEALSNQIVKNPTLPIFQLDYFTAVEKEQLLNDFNKTEVFYPTNKTIVDLFEENVKRNADNIAVVFESNSFTYKDIDEKSDQLAEYFIRKYNIKSEDLIAFKLNRTEWMIITILAILKSGAAFVPIDSQYPNSRIEYILKDSNCKVLFDENELSIFKKEEKNNTFSKPIIDSNNLAYVIYTSGTTGHPKGVAMEHKALMNYLFSINEKYQLNSDFLFITNISFDASLRQVFLPLINGKKIYVYDYFKFVSLPEYIVDNNLEIINTTPSIFNELIDLSHDCLPFKGLKTIMIGGETANISLLNKINEKIPHANLINAYGPTETCLNSITHKFTPSDTQSIIGKPLSNTQIYILDDYLRPVPIGVNGNLYISGAGLARCYLNKPELTNEKFLSNPFKDGERMYNTGDVAHWLPDGNVIFMGRNDNQVKIRGYRIEVEEIESVILNYSADLKQVVVIPKQINSEKVLVAYLVTNKNIEQSDLRIFLRENLPHYMIPSFFMTLDAIPLTFNGKINRNALPEITNDNIIGTKEEYVAPGNEIEVQLVKIWEEVLNIDKISIKDNFFEVGGNSIKIVKMVGLLNRNLNKKISLMTAFQYPNIESLALYLVPNKINDINKECEDDEIDKSIDLMDQTLLLLNNSVEHEK